MQRRFNYTNRQRIKHNDIAFSIIEDASGLPKFYADIELASYELPEGAEVWVEAYDRNAFMRFPFGMASSPSAKEETVLSDFVESDSYYFRVKVVDRESRSRLYAVADSISPARHDDEEDSSKSLLRVTKRDLGEVPWEVEFPGSDHPLLVINNQIDAGISLARANPFFQAIVFPAILDQILRKILVEEKYLPTGDPEADDMWKEGWLEFAGSLTGCSKLPLDQDVSYEEVIKWIEDARSSFCREINAVKKVRTELKELEL